MLKDRVMNELIVKKLLEQELKKRKIKVSQYDLDKKLKKQGLSVFDKTESVGKASGFHLSRGEGILQFLSTHTVEKYVILDDYQFDYDGCGLTSNYVKTDNKKGGLTEELAKAAIDILNKVKR